MAPKHYDIVTVGLLPAQELTSLAPNGEGGWQDAPEGQTVVPLVKIAKPDTGAWEPNLVWFNNRVERQWVAATPPPPPAVTAEEHLASVGLAGDRQPTLLYLRLNLQSAGKTSPELDQLEAYLSGILSIFAADPSPRNDWPQPPITFEAAVQSAMQTLNPLVP
jgi:hypothetical protein